MARSAAELSTSMQHRIFQNSFGLDGYFIFGSSRFSVSGNKCRDLRAQSFFVPAAAIVVLAEQLLVSATRPSSAEYRNPVRGLPRPDQCSAEPFKALFFQRPRGASRESPCLQ
jgi:hypothetical protein